jgi:DNA-binding response OmpR family regulator
VATEARSMRDVHLLAKPFSVAELLAAVRGALGADPVAGRVADPAGGRANETSAGAY